MFSRPCLRIGSAEFRANLYALGTVWLAWCPVDHEFEIDRTIRQVEEVLHVEDGLKLLHQNRGILRSHAERDQCGDRNWCSDKSIVVRLGHA